MQPQVYTHQGELLSHPTTLPLLSLSLNEVSLEYQRSYSLDLYEKMYPEYKREKYGICCSAYPHPASELNNLILQFWGVLPAVSLLLWACFRICLKARCSSQGHASFLGQLQWRGIKVQASRLYSGQSNRGTPMDSPSPLRKPDLRPILHPALPFLPLVLVPREFPIKTFAQ